MKNKKHIFKAAIALCLVFCTLFSMSSVAYAGIVIDQSTLLHPSIIPYTFFINDKNISGELVIPETVNGNPVRAVETVDGLQISSVSFPDTVNYINGFDGCTNLKSVKFPSSLNAIYGFSNCPSLETVEFPDTVSYISGFDSCTNLKSVKFPSSLQNIYAFSNCPSLETITLGVGCKDYIIKDGALMSADGARWIVTPANYTINVPEGVEEIFDDTFGEGINANIINLPSSLKECFNQSFDNCLLLEEVNVDEKNEVYKTIDGALCSNEYLFDKNEYAIVAIPYAKTTMHITREITSYGNNYLLGDGDFLNNNVESFTVDEDNEYYTAIDGVLFDKYKFELVAYPRMRKANNYTIPNGVSIIGHDAFFKCENLKNIVIPDGVTRIGSAAFEYCSSLTSIIIPDSVTSIWDHAFYNCSSLTSITLSDNLTYIGENAFDYTAYEDNPDNWENDCLYIGKYLIKCNPLAKNITIKPGTELISSLVFGGNSKNSTEHITIPDSVKIICSYAFWYCSSLVEITLPDSVSTINRGLFSGCSSLRSFTIGKNVKEIEDGVFNDCKSLEKITVAEGNKNFVTDENGVLYSKDMTRLIAYPYGSSLAEYKLPSSVSNIGNNVLLYCYNVKKFKVSDDNTNYATDELGALYTKDFRRLIAIPNLDVNEYYVKEGTETVNLGPAYSGFGASDNYDISNDIFYNSDELNSFTFTPNTKFIYIPSSVKNVWGYYYSRFICYSGDFEAAKEIGLIGYSGGGKYNTWYDGILLNCSKIPEVNRAVPKAVNYTDKAQISGVKTSAGTEMNGTVQMKFSEDAFNFDPGDISIEVGALLNEEASTVDVALGKYSTAPTAKFNIRAVKDGVTVHPEGKVTLMFSPSLFDGASIEDLIIFHFPSNSSNETFSYNDSKNKIYKGKDAEGKEVWCIDVTGLSPFAFVIDKNSNNNKPVSPLNGITLKAPSNATIGWKFKAQMTATPSKALPKGYHIAWYEGNKLISDKETVITDSLTSNHTYTAKIVDASGKVVSNDTQNKSVKVSVKTGFFDKLVSFFQRLFGKGITVL